MTNLNRVIEMTLATILEKCEIERLKYDIIERHEIFSHPLLEATRLAVKNLRTLTF